MIAAERWRLLKSRIVLVGFVCALAQDGSSDIRKKQIFTVNLGSRKALRRKLLERVSWPLRTCSRAAGPTRWRWRVLWILPWRRSWPREARGLCLGAAAHARTTSARGPKSVAAVERSRDEIPMSKMSVQGWLAQTCKNRKERYVRVQDCDPVLGEAG